MLRFQHIEWFWALIVIPIIYLLHLFVKRWKKEKRREYSDLELIPLMIPAISKGKPFIKLVLYSTAILLLIIAIANPQMGTKLEEVKREGIDIVVAMDVSNSMLAEDLQPNRLERAKRSMEQFIERLANDRIGIVVFAGQAYNQLPITTDYAAAKLFLSTISTGTVPVQGTAIGRAIELGMKSFNFEDSRNKALVIITDGENHEDDAIKAASDAASKGVFVYTVGMGSQGGAPIPVESRGQKNYRSDSQGNTVVSKLNEDMLKEIASAGDGIYVRANNSGGAMRKIHEEINKLEKSEFESKRFTDFEDRFQPFITLCILLLLLEFMIDERKSSWIEKLKLFN